MLEHLVAHHPLGAMVAPGTSQLTLTRAQILDNFMGNVILRPRTHEQRRNHEFCPVWGAAQGV